MHIERRRSRALLLSIAAAMLPALGLAHHSFPVTFNTSRVTEVTGAIIKLRWADPHVYFSVRGDSGDVWEVESNSIRGLTRYGITAETLAVDTRITIAGFPARNGDHKLYSSNLLLPDGTERVLRPGSEPRWTGNEAP